MQDRVDLGGAHDPVEDRVVGVGPYELRALEGQAGRLGVEPDDHLDVGDCLEPLREVAAPEGPETGDEDAHRYPRQTLRRRRSMS